MTDSILHIQNLSLQFDTEAGIIHAINNISFQIAKGESLALVGESGSGKSLTALAIMQLLPAAAQVDADSHIFLENQCLFDLSEVAMHNIRGRRIAMIFQEASTALNPVLTIGHQIKEVLRRHFNLNNEQQRNRVIQLLDDVGIKDPLFCAKSYPHQLSGGMRQRAMIAIALAAEPDILIADEPTTALDVTIQAQILELIADLQRSKQMTLLFITHDLAVVQQFADHVVVMKDGSIVEEATSSEFFKQPQHDYSKKLLAAIPGFNNRPEDLDRPIQTDMLLRVGDLKIFFPKRKGLLRRTYDYVRAVDGVDLELRGGKTLALVGESGSGKTTTGLGILRLLKPTAGNVVFEERNLAHLSPWQLKHRRADMQIIFQDPYSSMDPRMLVGDIIAEGMIAQNIGKTKNQRQASVDELLQLVGLDPSFKSRYPHEFSGGQRQRICIARALAMRPKFIVCDEPTSALDVTIQMQILDLLIRLQEELGISYLLITHNIAVVAYMAHDVAVMHQGKIVEQGTVTQVLNEPQHTYTQSLLAAVPTLHMSTSKTDGAPDK